MIRTDPALLALIERAKHHVMTPQERFEQRVSFVFGQMSTNPSLSKDQVRQMLIEHSGFPDVRAAALQALAENDRDLI